jgi:hypothetical protein
VSLLFLEVNKILYFGIDSQWFRDVEPRNGAARPPSSGAQSNITLRGGIHGSTSTDSDVKGYIFFLPSKYLFFFYWDIFNR